MRRLILGLTLLLIAVLVAACDTGTTDSGGGNTAAPDGASPTPEGAAQPTSEPGIILPGEGEMTLIGDPPGGSNPDTSTQGRGFVAQLSGPAFSGEIVEAGYIGCENDRYVIRSSNENFPQVTLILPPDVTPGTYSFGDMSRDPAAASASVTLADNQVFAGSVIGTLILNTVASAPGEVVSGSYDFSASNGESNLSVEGSMEFRAAEGTVFCQ